MMLGDVLRCLNDDVEATEVILGVGDLRLMTAAQQRAEAEGLALAAYLRGVVQRYAAEATDEEWITLMGTIGRAADPGMACVKRALESALGEGNASAPGHSHLSGD
jgi:hypothetical protein